jgi:hypothetical protein
MCDKHQMVQLLHYEHGLHVDENIVLNDQYRGHDIPLTIQTYAEDRPNHRQGNRFFPLSKRARVEMVPVFSDFLPLVFRPVFQSLFNETRADPHQFSWNPNRCSRIDCVEVDDTIIRDRGSK